MTRRPTLLPDDDGRQRRANSNQFDWDRGARRRLARLLESGLLSYKEIAQLMGVTKGAVSSAVVRYGLNLTEAQLRERQAAGARERATHGKRMRSRSSWESALIETWDARKARRARERGEAK